MSIRHIEVVVPARDEQDRIMFCLDRLHAAKNHLRRRRPQISCGITLVLDSCTDATAETVDGRGVRVLHCHYGSVGAARHLGSTDAIRRARAVGIRAGELWIAGTDADTTVPGNWLSAQADLADSGIDAVIGTVIPGELRPEMYRRWREDYRLVDGHEHVHGANLGLRASTYLAAGGFGPAAVHEDIELVARIRAITKRWKATDQISVLTSGRTHSHVHGGFATYLADLESAAPECG